MRAAAADHAAMVQSGAIATTPCSRLSNKSFASIPGPPLKNTTPRWPDRGHNGADGAAGALRWGRAGSAVKRRWVWRRRNRRLSRLSQGDETCVASSPGGLFMPVDLHHDVAVRTDVTAVHPMAVE